MESKERSEGTWMGTGTWTWMGMDMDGEKHTYTPASLLERYTTLVLGNRGKSLILLGKCGLGV